MAGYNNFNIPGFTWNDVPSAMWGFANRDEANTNYNIVWPCAVKQLGLNYGAKLESAQRTAASDSTPARWDPLTSSGIMTLDFCPLLAPERQNSEVYCSETYKRLWSYLRLFDAAVGEFQPNDLSAIDFANALAKTYLATCYKTFAVINSVKNGNNRYSQGNIMWQALGWSESFDYALEKLPTWIRKLNQKGIAALRTCKFLVNAMPGADRWAALVSKWYRDSYDDPAHSAVYTFRLDRFIKMENDPDTKTWKFIYTQYFPSTFEQFLNFTIEFINYMTYDESALQVQRYLNKVVTSGDDAIGDVTVSACEIGDIPYPLPDVIGFDTWEPEFNRDMLLSIHNATILHRDQIRVSDAMQTQAGDWTQTINFLQNDSKAFTAAGFTKPIDLPWEEANHADYINATTWTIIRHKEVAWDDLILDPQVLGSEIITGATIWRIDPNSAGSANETAIPFPFSNILNADVSSDIAFSNLDFASALFALEFNFSPLTYLISSRNAAEHTPGVINGIMTPNIEVLHIASYESLRDIKEQYVKNFWGYPFILDHTSNPGSFETTAIAGRVGNSLTNVPAPQYSEYKEDRNLEAPSNVFYKNARDAEKKMKSRSKKYKDKSSKDETSNGSST